MRRELIDHYETWTPWFAWHPVMIGNTRVWWEPVERKLKQFGYDAVWEYRLVDARESGAEGRNAQPHRKVSAEESQA